MPSHQPPRGTLADLVSGLLDREYERAARPVLNAIASSTSSGIMQQRLAELDAEAARLAEEGKRIQPDNPILRALLADLDDTLRGDSALIRNVAEPVQRGGIDAAGRIQRQLALPGMTDAQFARVGITWNNPDPEAVARLVGYAQSDAWNNLINRYNDDITGIIRNQAIRGIAEGWSPLRTAREIRRKTQQLPAHTANNLMRTLQLTSYRDSTAVHQQANSDIASQIIRIASLDTRTCLSCVAQHGDIIWDSDRDQDNPVPRVDDHHSGRCYSAMIVKGRPRTIQRGEDWFNALPQARQAEQQSFVDSPGKLAAFRDGNLSLRDFVQAYEDDVFGPMLREASLSGALSNRG